MTRAEIFSLGALAISLAGLTFSIFAFLRDRARIKTTSRFYPASEYGPAKVSVTIVNAGRRPIILRLWGGSGASDNWTGVFLGKDGKGLRLGEHERHDEILEKHDLLHDTPEGILQYEDLWFEDSLGRRHAVKNARRNIRLLSET